MIDWTSKLDKFGFDLIDALGGDVGYYLSTGRNIIVEALRNGDFVKLYSDMKGFNKSSVTRAAVVCQMTIFDAVGGPERDNERKAMRRHWYAWFKTTFAQPFSEQLGEDVQSERWGINWFAMLSTTYGYFVDKKDVTFYDLWVKDASRMMKDFWQKLFAGCNIVLCVEKDSLFEDFETPANAIGASAIYSGKGKSSKAAIEKMLTSAFNWSPQYQDDPFTAESPLIVLTVSDFDFDGHAVIDPTFAQQISRYTNHVVSSRVGIQPDQYVTIKQRSWDDAVDANDAYKLKLKNDGYLKWASQYALFWHECGQCNHKFVGQGGDFLSRKGIQYDAYVECPKCDGLTSSIHITKDSDARGFEVEALYTSDYHGLIVDALLRVLDFDKLVSKLRDECQASPDDAISPILNDILSENESYQRLLAEFDRLDTIKEEFENRAKEELGFLARPNRSMFRHLEDDPQPVNFREYVQNASGYVSPWRPFSVRLRTAKLTGWLREFAKSVIDNLEAEVIRW